jgi:probable rRNA maturation factor
MSNGGIFVNVEEPAWKKSGVDFASMKSAARLTLERGIVSSFLPRAGAGEKNGPRATVLLANDERLRALNAQFRGKDAPTNVLAFPTHEADGYVGDVAIALGVATREAAASGIGLKAHTLHLVVHGVLHLLGYDHVLSREASVMERLEIAILDELGLPSPYARAPLTHIF